MIFHFGLKGRQIFKRTIASFSRERKKDAKGRRRGRKKGIITGGKHGYREISLRDFTCVVRTRGFFYGGQRFWRRTSRTLDYTGLGCTSVDFTRPFRPVTTSNKAIYGPLTLSRFAL